MKKIYVAYREVEDLEIVNDEPPQSRVFETSKKAWDFINFEWGSGFVAELEFADKIDRSIKSWRVSIYEDINHISASDPQPIERFNQTLLAKTDRGWVLYVSAKSEPEAKRIAREKLCYVKENKHLYPYFDKKICTNHIGFVTEGESYPFYDVDTCKLCITLYQRVVIKYEDEIVQLKF